VLSPAAPTFNKQALTTHVCCSSVDSKTAVEELPAARISLLRDSLLSRVLEIAASSGKSSVAAEDAETAQTEIPGNRPHKQ
jgi:hypothetical protein